MSVVHFIEAIALLKPVIKNMASYLAGEHSELPQVPGVLESDIELKRMELRVVKPE